MRFLWLVSLCALASCAKADSAAEDAEHQFELAQNSGTYSDVCAAARRAADAYLARGDQENFSRWRVSRDIYCAAARRDPDGMPSRRQQEEQQAIGNEINQQH